MARVKITPYCMITEMDNDERYVEYFESYDELFYNASNFYAFDDLYEDLRVVEIICEGHNCHYTGWKPGMRYVFKDEEGEVMWDRRYPEWDH